MRAVALTDLHIGRNSSGAMLIVRTGREFLPLNIGLSQDDINRLIKISAIKPISDAAKFEMLDDQSNSQTIRIENQGRKRNKRGHA